MKKEFKNSSLEDALEECISLIKERKASLEDCLERYPAWRDELEPLLKAALVLQSVPAVEPSPSFRQAARYRLMQKIQVPKPAISRRFSWRGLTVRLVAASLVLLLTLGSVAFASTKSMPDSPLYPIKRFIEQTRLNLTFSDHTRARLRLSFAEARLEEAKIMVRLKKIDKEKMVLKDMGREMAETFKIIQKLSNKDREALVAKFISISQRQQAVLTNVIDRAPEEAKEALEHARETSKRGLEEAEEAVEKRKEHETKPKPEKPKGKEKLEKHEDEPEKLEEEPGGESALHGDDRWEDQTEVENEGE